MIVCNDLRHSIKYVRLNLVFYKNDSSCNKDYLLNQYNKQDSQEIIYPVITISRESSGGALQIGESATERRFRLVVPIDELSFYFNYFY